MISWVRSRLPRQRLTCAERAQYFLEAEAECDARRAALSCKESVELLIDASVAGCEDRRKALEEQALRD